MHEHPRLAKDLLHLPNQQGNGGRAAHHDDLVDQVEVKMDRADGLEGERHGLLGKGSKSDSNCGRVTSTSISRISPSSSLSRPRISITALSSVLKRILAASTLRFTSRKNRCLSTAGSWSTNAAKSSILYAFSVSS